MRRSISEWLGDGGGGVTRLLALVGPTGIGKTELSLEIARRLPAEIIVVDSMQVYRGMDIGTGKPAAEALRAVPHHGLDLADPEEEFDVLRYAQAVGPAIEQALARGRWAILVGGCGLYLRVLLNGLCQAPGRDPEVRSRLLEEASRVGAAVLHSRLESVDPAAAKKIHPNDLRRIVRALEVFEVSGRPISRWQEETTRPAGELAGCRIVGLTCGREGLYDRIRRRVDGWLEAGWLEEARSLSRRPLSRTAREALGYRELYRHLEGRMDWDETRSLIHKNSRRYAKRQWSWFRRDPRVRWMNVDGMDSVSAAEALLQKGSGTL